MSILFQVSTVRPSGIYAKVNRIVFSQQGNKFGVCDGDGQVTLWQAANTTQSYLNLQLHNKNCADFLFQVSVAIWSVLIYYEIHFSQANPFQFLKYSNGTSMLQYKKKAYEIYFSQRTFDYHTIQ